MCARSLCQQKDPACMRMLDSDLRRLLLRFLQEERSEQRDTAPIRCTTLRCRARRMSVWGYGEIVTGGHGQCTWYWQDAEAVARAKDAHRLRTRAHTRLEYYCILPRRRTVHRGNTGHASMRKGPRLELSSRLGLLHSAGRDVCSQLLSSCSQSQLSIVAPAV